MINKTVKQNLLRKAGNYFLFTLVDLLCRSVRIKVVNKNYIEELFNKNEKFVLAFWHGYMLIPWFLHRNKNFGALVSMSKDGDLLAKVLSKWNYKVVRGSSHKGGKEALGNIMQLIAENHPVAITPDGPTGPPHKMKAGAVVAAKKSGVPLVLLGVHYRDAKTLKSWDSFRIPKPFSNVCVVYSEPINIDENSTYEETSMMIAKAGEKLNDLQMEAEKLC